MQLFGGKFNFVVMQDHDKLRSNFDTFWDSLLTVFQVTASFSHSFSERLEPLWLFTSLYVKRIPARLRQRRVSLLQTADFALLCTCTAFPKVSIHPLKSAAPAFSKTVIIKPLRMHTVHRCGLLLQSIAWYLSLCKCAYMSFCLSVIPRPSSHRQARPDKSVLSVSCLPWQCELDSRQLKTVADRKYEV